MKSMRPILSNNYKKDAKKIRDERDDARRTMQFLNTSGAVPWQEKYVCKYKNPYQR